VSRTCSERFGDALGGQLGLTLPVPGRVAVTHVSDILVLIARSCCWLKGLMGVVHQLLRTRVLRGYTWNRKGPEASPSLFSTRCCSWARWLLLQLLGLDLSSLALFAQCVRGCALGPGPASITKNFISGLIIIFEKRPHRSGLISFEIGALQGTVHGSAFALHRGLTLDRIAIIFVSQLEFLESQVVNEPWQPQSAG